MKGSMEIGTSRVSVAVLPGPPVTVNSSVSVVPTTERSRATLWSVSAAPVRLTVASYPDLDQALKLALPAFARRHPGVEVNVVTLSHKDHHTAMTTALATRLEALGVQVGTLHRDLGRE